MAMLASNILRKGPSDCWGGGGGRTQWMQFMQPHIPILGLEARDGTVGAKHLHRFMGAYMDETQPRIPILCL
jgi:hypothetical protein